MIAWRSDYQTNFVLDNFQFFCIAASSKARSTSELMSYYEAVAVVATMLDPKGYIYIERHMRGYNVAESLWNASPTPVPTLNPSPHPLKRFSHPSPHPKPQSPPQSPPS